MTADPISGKSHPARKRRVSALSGDHAATATKEKPAPVSEASAPSGTEQRRFGTGRTLGSILPRVTRPAFNKRAAPAVRLLLDWAEIVGPALALQTQPRRVTNGTLTIACTGPVALELQHLAPQLIERINTHCGPLRTGKDLRFDDGTILVKRLRIVQDSSVLRPTSPAARPAPPPVPVPDLKEGALREVLSRLGGHVRRSRKQ